MLNSLLTTFNSKSEYVYLLMKELINSFDERQNNLINFSPIFELMLVCLFVVCWFVVVFVLFVLFWSVNFFYCAIIIYFLIKILKKLSLLLLLLLLLFIYYYYY